MGPDRPQCHMNPHGTAELTGEDRQKRDSQTHGDEEEEDEEEEGMQVKEIEMDGKKNSSSSNNLSWQYKSNDDFEFREFRIHETDSMVNEVQVSSNNRRRFNAESEATIKTTPNPASSLYTDSKNAQQHDSMQ